MAQPLKDAKQVNVVDYADDEHEGGSGQATPLARGSTGTRASSSNQQRTSPVSPNSKGPATNAAGERTRADSSQLSLGQGSPSPFDRKQDGNAFTESGPLSPSSSSSASFVFPVRSVFANRNQSQVVRRDKKEPAHNAQQQSQYQAPSTSGGLPQPQAPGNLPARDRSPSLPAGTAGSSISSILAQGESIQNMLEGYTYDLAEIHKHLPWAHLNNENSQAGPSNGYRPPGVVGSGFYSAPLPAVAESTESTYFIDALLNEERRKSDGTEMAPRVSSPSNSRSPCNLPVSSAHGSSSSDRSQHEMHRTANRDSDTAGHAYGQIDPAPKDAPAPGQTTERSGKDEDGDKTYSFSHHPRNKDEKINISGPSDGKRIRNTRNASNRQMRDEEGSDEADEQDDADEEEYGPRPVTLGDNFQSHGLGDSGERSSEDSGESGSRTDTVYPVRRRHEGKEPDVGPAGDGRNDVFDQDETPTEDKKQEEGGLSGVATPSSTRPQGGSPRGSRPGSAAASQSSDMRPFDDGITLLPGRPGEEGNTESSYGTRTSSLRGSKDALHSAMRGGKKQNKAQVNSVPDYQSSVQKFVDRQAKTTNLSDPNAPTPSPGPGEEPASNQESAVEDNDDGDDMMMDAESSAERSASEVSRTGEEPLMTVRFEHVTTDDGHHVVTGREGQLKKCEDEPITTPGSVQSFGVLMVLEENFETDELVVRQVSENSTDILGLSPKYLFKVSCFTRNLSRHQEHVLRDNIDYLPDPDTDEDTLTDEGPHVFLLSGFGEPGTGDRDVSDSLSNGSSVTDNRRKEWTCWVAAHRPAQNAAKRRGTGAANQEAEPRNLIILEFELEKDFQNPLYPPVRRTAASGVSSPTTGSNTSTTTGSGTSMHTASSVNTVKGGEGNSDNHSTNLRPSVAMTPRTNSQDSGISDSTLQVRVQEDEIMGLDGEDVDVRAEDILESTTSHAKPLRALERLRRMTRNQTQPTEDGSQSSKSARPRPNRRGTGSGGVGTMDVFAVLAQINDQLSQAPDLDSFLKIVVGVIKDLTQFHRCLVYSFDSQWNGLVVAELVDWSKTHDLYKGLQFPATDIPAQARELYRINKVRLLYDRTHTTARMVLRSKRDLDNPVDMTHCYLRAMSPIHMVYLKNMGVRSSMSISIMAFGSLWGLIACHGYGNHGLRVSFPVRQMLRLLSDSVSRNIERLSYAARLHTRKLISTIPTDAHPTGYIVSNANDLLTLFDADCGVLVIGEGAKILGSSTEHGQEILLIAEYLRYKRFNQMQISSHIGEDFPDLVSSRNLQIISGLLYVPLSTGGQDFIAFLRKGQSRQVHWAGKPYKDGKEKGANLEPRQSFKVWSETIAGKSKNWTDEQLETAGVLALVYGKFIEVWRQKESALKANQMTSLLLSNATHEVRTPLNQIINYLELALDGQLDGETRDNLSRSHTASKSLLFTINDLLDLTRIESGNETAFNDPFDIRQCIKDAARIYASEAKRRGLEYNIDVHAAPDCFLLGDQKKIRTVVANLIANAVKYTEKGSVSVSCRARGPDEESAPSTESGFVQTEIIVADTGCGIPSDQLQAMFVTLEQADSAENQSATGLGLGLAVVARIIEQVGGTLRADSDVGRGSKFYFNITMARHEGTATASDNSMVKPPRRSGSMGSGSGSAISSTRSTGTRELDGFVDAFSQSHMAKAGPDDERIRSAEARMSQPGTFPVTDSSWPIKPAKMNDDKQLNQDVTRPNYSRSQSAYAHNSARSPPLRITTSAGDPSVSSGPHSPSETAQTDDTLDTRATDDSKPKKKRRTPVGGKLRILVVEVNFVLDVTRSLANHLWRQTTQDDDVNRKILERRLKLDGHEVVSDTNGQEAVDRIREDPNFDCILMDIQMPVMDGRESAANIRKNEPLMDSISPTLKRVDGRIPILAVSATLLEADRSKLAVDFDGWILKPIDFKRMLRLLSGISLTEYRVEDAYVRGQWERGGWFNSLKNTRRKSSRH